jgi:hypothetical protein
LDPESQQLDWQLQTTTAHRELLHRLSADLIAGRSTLPESATVLADFARQNRPGCNLAERVKRTRRGTSGTHRRFEKTFTFAPAE